MAESNWQRVDTDNSTMRIKKHTQGLRSFSSSRGHPTPGRCRRIRPEYHPSVGGAGYVAAAPDLYHRDGPECTDDIVARRTRLRDRTIISDLNATAAFLQQQIPWTVTA